MDLSEYSSEEYGSDEEELRNVKPSTRSVNLRERQRKR